MIELTPDALRQAVETLSYGAIGAGFLAGLVFSFNPVAVAAIPVALAYVTHARERREALWLGGLFVSGLIATHVLLGLIAGFGGRWVTGLMGRGWGLALGPLLIALGLVWAGWIKLPLPPLPLRAKCPTSAWGAFALGVPFSVAVCPVCTPALLALLGVVAALGSPWLGVVMLLAFALGRAIPILLGAWAIGWLETLRGLGRIRRAFDVTAGLTLIASGLYLLNAYFVVFPALSA
jgi:cytochrome c-type biogenesis protein